MVVGVGVMVVAFVDVAGFVSGSNDGGTGCVRVRRQ